MESNLAEQRQLKEFVYAEAGFLLAPFLLIIFLLVAADVVNANIYILAGLSIIFSLTIFVGFFIGWLGLVIYFDSGSSRPALLLLLSSLNIPLNGFLIYFSYQFFIQPWHWRMF